MNARTKQRENAARLLIEYPFTQGKAALWFHYKLAPNSVAYNMAGVVAVQSNTDLASRGVGGTWSKETFITAVRTRKVRDAVGNTQATGGLGPRGDFAISAAPTI